MLDIDRAAASAMRGIQAVETALADDERRSLLLAMATGTGKTKLAVALLAPRKQGGTIPIPAGDRRKDAAATLRF